MDTRLKKGLLRPLTGFTLGYFLESRCLHRLEQGFGLWHTMCGAGSYGMTASIFPRTLNPKPTLFRHLISKAGLQALQ